MKDKSRFWKQASKMIERAFDVAVLVKLSMLLCVTGACLLLGLSIVGFECLALASGKLGGSIEIGEIWGWCGGRYQDVLSCARFTILIHWNRDVVIVKQLER